MEKINEKHENQTIERVSDVDALAIHQSENTSERNGLVSVVYHASWNKISHEKSCGWSQEGGTVNRVLYLPVLGCRGNGVMTRGG